MKFTNITGLTDSQVTQARQKYGSNELPPPEVESFWDKLWDNFQDPLIRILLVALLITCALAFLGYADWIEGIGIAVAVFLATVVSTWSEYRNEESFRSLQEKASRVKNNVFRNGLPSLIFATEIVVGDYVLLQAGDKIPADGKLVIGDLQVVQASLTGEPDSRKKSVPPKGYTPNDKKDFDDEYLCFRETVVDDGEAVLIVDAVGVNTCYGELHVELTNAAENRPSPLQVKLEALADAVSTFGYIGATLIAISFLFKQFVIDQGYSWDKIVAYVSLANWQLAFKDVVTSVILAIIVIVVAVPEGLPMMIAIVLSLNMRKLLKANVLVRRLLGIETAGSVDILFVDKTGTLTKGLFTPQVFVTGNCQSYNTFDDLPQPLQYILAFCLRESTSSVITEKGPIGGNASDRAVLAYLTKKALLEKADCSIDREILFNSNRKFSAAQVSIGKNKTPYFQNNGITLIKGAPELLLPQCKYYYSDSGKQEKLPGTDHIIEKLNSLTGGIRVIAIATSDGPLVDEKIPETLTLVGIIGIMDEIRKESKGAVQLARSAGIHVVMITGDRKETAISVAQQLDLLKDNKTVLTSSQLKGLTDEQLQAMLPNIAVIARALPTDKSRLVRVCKSLGRVVGMTGDGVNDSAALKSADVGFAMGSGSEVAKEASDIVILDDNFASITQAVLYGRTIFKSIRKFIVFQSTVNCASLLIVFMGPFLGYDFPLTLIQLLWVNLVMDTLAAMAFGGEPALKRTMHEKPIPRDESIINLHMWSAIITNGIFIALMCVNVLRSTTIRGLFVRDGVPNEQVFLTAFFAYFIFQQAFNAFNARTPKINIIEHIAENPGFGMVIVLIFIVQVIFTYVGGNVLRTVGLTFTEWMLVIGASALIIPFDMVRKFVMNKILPSNGNGNSSVHED